MVKYVTSIDVPYFVDVNRIMMTGCKDVYQKDFITTELKQPEEEREEGSTVTVSIIIL